MNDGPFGDNHKLMSGNGGNDNDGLPDIALSHDGIINKRYHLYQPKQGYRFGTDAILLASAIGKDDGSRIAEFGAGVGAVAIALSHRLSDCHITAIEKDDALVSLLRHNRASAGFSDIIRPLQADITSLPALLDASFDQVIANPPFHHPASTRPRHARRSLAHHGDEAKLDDWVAASLKALKPKGRLTMILRADRLDDLIVALRHHGAGGITVLPIWPYKSSPAIRVIVTARKAISAPFTMLDGLVLHHPDGALTMRAEQILAGEQGWLFDGVSLK